MGTRGGALARGTASALHKASGIDVPASEDKRGAEAGRQPETGEDGRPHGPSETLRVQMELVPGQEGPMARDVRVGDRITVTLSDGRDIAHYIARLFGVLNENGPSPFEAPVETIQKEEGRVRFHVRLSAGILGLTEAPETFRVRVLPREADSWWRRFLRRGPP